VEGYGIDVWLLLELVELTEDDELNNRGSSSRDRRLRNELVCFMWVEELGEDERGSSGSGDNDAGTVT
jgi:hypothetical protein